jgi:hypothetical protein
VKQYKNEDTLPAVLSNVHGIEYTSLDVKREGDLVGRKLASIVLRHLIASRKKDDLRWKVQSMNPYNDTY